MRQGDSLPWASHAEPPGRGSTQVNRRARVAVDLAEGLLLRGQDHVCDRKQEVAAGCSLLAKAAPE